MNIKRELIALAVRIVANNTTLVRQPQPFESFLNQMFGEESYDQQVAQNIEVELDRAARAVKTARRHLVFKKIAKNYDVQEESPE